MLIYYLCCVNNLSLKTLDTGHLNKLNICVKLLICILVLVSLPAQPNSDTLWWVPDSLAPDKLVHFDIKSDIFGAHSLSGEFFDLLNGTGCLGFEGGFVGVLGEVDGVIPGHKVGLSFTFTCHSRKLREVNTVVWRRKRIDVSTGYGQVSNNKKDQNR